MFNCYSEKLFKYLVLNDLIPIRQRKNLKNPNFYVWVFADSENLRTLVQEYSLKEEK